MYQGKRIVVFAVIQQITIEQGCGLADLAIGKQNRGFFEFGRQAAHGFLNLDAGTHIFDRWLDAGIGWPGAERVIAFLQEGKEIIRLLFAEERKHATSAFYKNFTEA
jgi:hypothetical protein